MQTFVACFSSRIVAHRLKEQKNSMIFFDLGWIFDWLHNIFFFFSLSSMFSLYFSACHLCLGVSLSPFDLFVNYCDLAFCSFLFTSVTVKEGDEKAKEIFYRAYCDNKKSNAGL